MNTNVYPVQVNNMKIKGHGLNQCDYKLKMYAFAYFLWNKYLFERYHGVSVHGAKRYNFTGRATAF